MTSPALVQVVQYRPDSSAEANLAAMAPHVAAAAAAGAAMVVFPEYSEAFFPGDGPAMAAVAEPAGGRFLQGLHALSRDHGGIVVVAGVLIKDEGIRNTMVAMGPEGVMVRAEKIHLYDAFGYQESAWCVPGRIASPQILDLDGLRFGFIACYDLRFPETVRRLVDAGATAIVVPAQWVPGPRKREHFETLLRARAIEAQCFVIAADHPEPHGVGFSQIISPRGDVLGFLEAGEGVVSALLDPGEVDAVRSENPMASARRFVVAPKSSPAS